MPTVEELVAQAKQAYRSGRAGEARDLLRSALQRDPQHEDAWLWLSGMVETLEEQQYCLRKVLTLNPAHDRARQGLAAVERRLAGATGKAAETRREPRRPARDPNAPATSVEWGRDDRPAFYGSGKQITLPSDREYDAWVNELHLSENARPVQEQAAPFVADEPGLFGDTALMADTGPFVDGAPGWSGADPGDFDGAWSSLGYGSRQSSPESGGHFAGSDLPNDDSQPDEWRDLTAALHRSTEPPPAPRHEFSFAEADEGVPVSAEPQPVLNVPVPPAAAVAPARLARSEPSPSGPEAFFAYIPAEIEAARGFSRRSLALALVIVLLIAANFAAVIALVGAI